jgi:hypothetical protein
LTRNGEVYRAAMAGTFQTDHVRYPNPDGAGRPMSRQCRFFLLPSDAETLVADLRDRIGLKLIDAKSSGPEPVEIDSPMHSVASRQDGKTRLSAYCYITAATDANVKLRYIAQQGYWLVHEERSEVIQFHGLEYDGEIMLVGRFYFQNDFLLGDAIWPKRDQFHRWADRIFRRAKATLAYSKGLDAYIGPDAEAWRAHGGRFAWMWISGQEPRFAVERE